MEMLLMGMGGCTAFDVIHILKKGRHDIRDCELQLDAERSEPMPRFLPGFTYIIWLKGKICPIRR